MGYGPKVEALGAYLGAQWAENNTNIMRRSNAPISQDFSDVRSNLRYHGRDILNVPTPCHW